MSGPLEAAGLSPPGRRAPPWRTGEWLNSPLPISLESLRGKVVVLHAFQMLCPACVSHGLPQAQRIHELFPAAEVAVMGLHTVFEHHEAMTPAALRAFVHEYRFGFPVGIDAPSGDPADPVPATMRAYALRGTPSLILIDRNGFLRRHSFGADDDLALGAAIATLAAETKISRRAAAAARFISVFHAAEAIPSTHEPTQPSGRRGSGFAGPPSSPYLSGTAAARAPVLLPRALRPGARILDFDDVGRTPMSPRTGGDRASHSSTLCRPGRAQANRCRLRARSARGSAAAACADLCDHTELGKKGRCERRRDRAAQVGQASDPKTQAVLT